MKKNIEMVINALFSAHMCRAHFILDDSIMYGHFFDYFFCTLVYI